MKYIPLAILLSTVASGCVWTEQYREVIVHKDVNGKLIGTDYKESLTQRDLLPWQDGFGTWLYSEEKTPRKKK